MRFLIDEMFGGQMAVHLTACGHDAVHVADVELLSAPDADVLCKAVADDRVLLTENADDFIALLDEREKGGGGLPLAVVVIARKSSVRGKAMHRALAERLVRWAKENPEPYRHVHWLPKYRG
ncbi:MAG TPA: DUF5615 family PIN-like protein [Acidimicrobiales bacterium]